MENFGIPTDEQWLKMKKFLKSERYKKEDFFLFLKHKQLEIE